MSGWLVFSLGEWRVDSSLQGAQGRGRVSLFGFGFFVSGVGKDFDGGAGSDAEGPIAIKITEVDADGNAGGEADPIGGGLEGGQKAVGG